MSRRILFVVVIVLTVSMCVRDTVCAQSDEFRRAYAIYAYGEYRRAAKEFSSLLYPLKLTDKEEILKAHQYLGICYFLLDEKVAAENEFGSILRIEPGYSLDPLFTPPEIVGFFDNLKKAAEQEARTEARKRQALFALNFVPFGVGQFQNGHRVKGYVLLGTEGAALVTNILTYYLRTTMEASPNHYLSQDVKLANKLQDTQIVAFWVFVGAGVYGIVDALWHFPTAAVSPAEHGGT